MATEIRTSSPAPPEAGSGLVPYRLTVEQFLRMVDAGIFPAGPRVELLGGRLFAKMTKNDLHDFAVYQMGRRLWALLPADWCLREEKSVTLGRHWRPEPDITVVRGPGERYGRQAPQAGDIGLLIEVADSSYRKDRGAMWRGYAEAGVAVYWIVNIPGRRVEVYARPTGRGRAAKYETSAVFDEAAEVPVHLDGREIGRVAVRDMLV